MEKGKQYGEWVYLSRGVNEDDVIALNRLITETFEVFSKPEFEGLSPKDFKIEVINKPVPDMYREMKRIDLSITQTLAIKLTKK